MGLGIALFAHLWWLTLIYILVFWLYYERIIFAEEEYLRNKFGQAYLEWANETPAFIPRFDKYKKADLPFSLKNVLRREYNGFFALVFLMAILEVTGDIRYQGEFDVDAGWLLLATTSLVLWVVLRSLKKYTNILNVEGR